MGLLKILGLCRETSGLGLEIFHCTWRKNHLSIKLHQHFWIVISGMCLEISSMCREIWIVHKDCAIFYPMTEKFLDSIKFPVYFRKFSACVWKFPDLYKFLECVRKFAACVRKLWSYKIFIFVFYHMTQQISRLIKVSGVCPEVFSMC